MLGLDKVLDELSGRLGGKDVKGIIKSVGPKGKEVREINEDSMNESEGTHYKFTRDEMEALLNKPASELTATEAEHVKNYKGSAHSMPGLAEDIKPERANKAEAMGWAVAQIAEMPTAEFDEIAKAIKIIFPKEDAKDILLKVIAKRLLG